MAGSVKNVAIIFGGKSVEHSVSINSAKNVFQYIDRDVYNPILIGVDRQGRWFQCDNFDSDIEIGSPLNMKLGDPGVIYSEEAPLFIDIVFPLIHGTTGEDGSIQGLLQMMGLPFVGTGSTGSALCMNKLLSKVILTENGIPNTPFLSFTKEQKGDIEFNEVKKELGLPFMVKAVNLGSSVGINKVTDKKSFDKALKDSFKYDREIIIEKFIQGREIECAIKGNVDPETSFPGEIIISDKYEFYSFDAKYVDEEAVTIEVPARLDDKIREDIRKACREAFIALKCEDYARVDIFLTKKGSFYINEINTIPGFTNASMFPMMWKHHGVSFTELISQLIGLAEKRYEILRDIETSYISKLDN